VLNKTERGFILQGREIMSFTENQICTSRQNCVPCRRDARFRENFEKQFNGAWECPLKIPIDATDEQFPKDIIERYKEFIRAHEERQKKAMEAQVALDELAMVLTGEDLRKIELIRTLFFPQTKAASKCQNSTKKIGEVDQVCCGGTIKKVDTFDCSKHTLCTDKKCQACNDFISKK
jgi:hypothetical protein